MDDIDDMKKVEKSLFQRDGAMAGWLKNFAPHCVFMVLDLGSTAYLGQLVTTCGNFWQLVTTLQKL